MVEKLQKKTAKNSNISQKKVKNITKITIISNKQSKILRVFETKRQLGKKICPVLLKAILYEINVR